jgi:hypothetical protein
MLTKHQKEVRATAEMGFAHAINKACRSELKGEALVSAVREAAAIRQELLDSVDARPINPLAAWANWPSTK